jgi:tRNA(fMet)-specific endonuclease VapC
MAIIIDADVIIGGEKGTFDLQEWLEARGHEQFEIAAITVAELWHGVERASVPHKAVRESYLRAILSALPIIPYSEQTAYHHARLWAELETVGKMIGPHDLILAATAQERGSEIATFNKRHFAAVPGAKLVEPR